MLNYWPIYLRNLSQITNIFLDSAYESIFCLQINISTIAFSSILSTSVSLLLKYFDGI
jgi:hypothetical protein